MLRILLLLAGLVLAQPVLAQKTPPHNVGQTLEADMWEILHLSELMPIIRDEAMSEAEVMQNTIFERGGDGRWRNIVKQIHKTDRLERLLRDGLAQALNDAPPLLIDDALEFYRSELGQRMIRLENSTRRAMLNDGVEDDALAAFSKAVDQSNPRAAQISKLIDTTGLIEQNVAGGMNAALAFSKGFESAGGYQTPMTEAQMLEDAWKQEPLIREQALGWLEGFLYLACSPLSDAELDEYIEFSESPAGKALMQAMFEGFNTVFTQTSYEMGVAAAGQLSGRAL